MYKSIVASIGVMFCCAAASGQAFQVPHIRVCGTATTDVVPDQMIWALSVRDTGPIPAEVAAQHATTVSQVLEFLKQAEIAEEDIQTSGMHLGERQVKRNDEWVADGYVASTDLCFKSADFAKYKELWLGLIAIHGVGIGSVRYEHSKRTEIENETRLKAIADARDKAIALARVLGAEIAEPLRIDAGLSVENPPRMNPFGAESDDEGNMLARGRIPICAQVEVTFRLVPRDP